MAKLELQNTFFHNKVMFKPAADGGLIDALAEQHEANARLEINSTACNNVSGGGEVEIYLSMTDHLLAILYSTLKIWALSVEDDKVLCYWCSEGRFSLLACGGEKS